MPLLFSSEHRLAKTGFEIPRSPLANDRYCFFCTTSQRASTDSVPIRCTEMRFWVRVTRGCFFLLGASRLADDLSFNLAKKITSGTQGTACRDEGIFLGESLLQQGDEPLGTYSYRTSSRSISISRF